MGNTVGRYCYRLRHNDRLEGVAVTVGEKIGKNPLTYAQGASVQVVAMLTIGLAAVMGLPVSTTHVLSSRGYGEHGC